MGQLVTLVWVRRNAASSEYTVVWSGGESASRQHSPGKNYDPDVIDKYEEFGPWWRQQNGLPPR
ncbi:hypothetical protein GCM10027088_43700 [Nocardia goodfellowii]|uniref:Uncharacterized protein n=1 Tax=Nocardia goodfellowii TaxID=882446 RepID=A0ABS4QJJ9_9NOCA|nr:hypothetical protein [Nocardia goodfellowii]